MREKDLARIVLNQQWDEKIPVDIMGIASAHAVLVADSFSNVVAEVNIRNGASPVIRVNTRLPTPIRRFATAHCLHHILTADDQGHATDLKESGATFMLNAKDAREVSANLFAIYLLAPSAKVAYYRRTQKNTTVADLARWLNVPVSTAQAALHIYEPING